MLLRLRVWGLPVLVLKVQGLGFGVHLIYLLAYSFSISNAAKGLFQLGGSEVRARVRVLGVRLKEWCGLGLRFI